MSEGWETENERRDVESRKNPSRAAYRAAGKRRKARRSAKNSREQHGSAVGAALPALAFARDPDARHAQDTNPNRGKRSASKAGINLADDSRGERERISFNQGRRKRGETSRAQYLETWNARIPSLPPTLSKRVPTS